jgi:hypothetical protein
MLKLSEWEMEEMEANRFTWGEKISLIQFVIYFLAELKS